MTYSFSGHPSGGAGVALLLLRLAAALTIAGAYFHEFQGSLDRLIAIALAICLILLVLGLGTRIVAAVCAVTAIAVGTHVGHWHGGLVALEALNLVSLALLGAGAYSIDARLFGRRVIRIDE